jgi:drug/metabolite transporter (DMT)-like permease
MVLNLEVDRFVFAFLRITSGLAVITCIALWKKHLSFKRLRANVKHFIVLGILFSGCGILLKLWGLSLTTATNTSFIMSLSSVSAVMFAFLLLREQAPGNFYLLVLLMMFGVYLVTTGGERLLPRKGDLIILALMILIGFMQVYGKRVLETLSVLETAFGRSLFGTGFLFILIMIFSPQGFSSITDFPVLLLVLANGLTFSGSILFFYMALQSEGASQTAVFALLVPVLTAVMGKLLLNERLSLIQIIGGGIIIAGSFRVSRIKIKQANF